jgi:phenylalanyl-tRNA synthetase beta chain
MKISLKWLNDHIDIEDYYSKADELAQLLTNAGLEVDAIENPAQAFTHVVTGKIEKLDRHPNADRLTVCQVDVGTGSLQQIVCGAKNHKTGDKVVVTLPGAVLPGNFEIKKSKIRDVESNGMLASEVELGLAKESPGIMILPADAPIGKPFAEYYGLDDVLLEINVTPNRADCLSHLGLAREISCLLDRKLKAQKNTAKSSAAVNTQKTVDLKLNAPELCSRYSGRVVKGVKVGPSPDWLKRRLESIGLKSINNVVDVTNFIQFDLGQPLHAFDIASLKGSKIIVDKATPGEKFKTLDGTDLTLAGDELTIRDGERAVCIAGAIGGINSGVTDKTQDVFVESAHFAMDSVRRSARRHGLQTDSAYRFSRGTDPSGVVDALERAVGLIQQVAGGEIAKDHWDLKAKVPAKKAVAVDAEYVEQRLGYEVKAKDLEKWLKRLGGDVDSAGSGKFKVIPPSFRMDLETPEDFVEEYGRLNGYDHIPDTLPPMNYAPLAQDKNFVFEQRVAELSRNAGMAQTVNYGFIGSKFMAETLGPVDGYKTAGLEMDSQPIRLKNPLSEDLDVMRVSLVPGLLRNLLHNYRHGQGVGRLFEVGYTFKRGPEGYVQEPRLAIVAWGENEGLWLKNDKPQRTLFDIKARLMQIFEKLLIPSVQWKDWAQPPKLLHPAQSATIFVEGRNIGYLASVHPQWLSGNKIRVPVVVAELDLKALGRGQPRTVKFKPVSKFPSVERDLAFVMPKSARAQDVASEIKKAAGTKLQSIDVFDVFEGGNLPADHLSVAYRMIFQDQEGTLTEEQLTALQAQIVSHVEKKLAIKVR